ncbi:nucleotide exchange factor GrpE [soil metagenome]
MTDNNDFEDVPTNPSVAVASAEGASTDRASLARALRDLESAKARVERDAKQAAADARKKLVTQILPVLDNLERTIRAADESGDAPTVAEGVRMVRKQLEGVLKGFGVERIDASNARFDPKLHEALSTVPVIDPLANGLVLDQIEPGYRFGEQLLRPAKVIVAKYSPARQAVPTRWY